MARDFDSSQAILVGESQAMEKLRAFIKRAAAYDAPVILMGETGTGKNLVACLIHSSSRRREKRFVSLNCANLPESLAESELFGHRKGAFTSADRDKLGLCEEADGGTLFLNEITELTSGLQAKFLDFLDTGEVRKVGDTRSRRVDVRLIVATNKELVTEISSGRFRIDLYYRLCGLRYTIPPLRERTEDITPIVEYFLQKELAGFEEEKRKTRDRQIKERLPELMKKLLSHRFRGNIREMEAIVRRFVSGEEMDELFDPVSLDRENRNAIPQALFSTIKEEGKDFWEVVGKPFLRRELSRWEAKEVMALGLRETGGSYKNLLRLFHLGEGQKEYKKFMDFIRHLSLH